MLRCCNTCQELKEAYQEMGMPYFHILDTAMQCRNSVGCRVHGDVLVSKVGGNVHVALGKSTAFDRPASLAAAKLPSCGIQAAALVMEMMHVLSESGLDHIKKHQYKAGKYTPLDNLLNPYWIQLAEALPRWLAPNTVTLVGFCPLVISYALSYWVSPSFETPPPRWLMFVMTGALFFYQTMDAMDGKQARRTGSSSPLGQLFDHGCDCLACVAQTGAAAAVLSFGPNFLGLFSLNILSSGFFMAQWEEYHTGTLPTAYGPVGVTETQFFLMGLTLVSGLLGPQVVESFTNMELNLPLLGTVVFKTLFLKGWMLFVGFFMTMCMLKNVAQALRERGLPGAAVLQDLVPVLLQNVLLACWSPQVVAAAAREISLWTLLLLFYYTAQMILFSMARMPFPMLQKWLAPYALLVLLSWAVPPLLLRRLLVGLLTVFGVWLLWWLASVQKQLTRKLEIYTFNITKKYVNGAHANKSID
ncbi:unnamed protein product [Durusdinium trenchii]|uniref:Endoplasmic reticulum vesicle transporter C-terminal domain-containing protein n=2 Tax=Durusdinium trenchii TaxID=1381693 RepID=A0ABP0J7K5_9DINO